MKDDEKLRNDDLSICWSLKIKFDKLTPSAAPCRTDFVRTRDHENHLDDDARPEGRAVRRGRRRLNVAHIQFENLHQNKQWIKNQIPQAQEGKVVSTNSRETSSNISQLSKKSKISTNDFAKSRPFQFEHTLMLDDSKYKFKFFLDTGELTMSIASFGHILQLPQAIDNNNAGFVDAPGFSLITFQEKYHIVENDDLVKSIFNSGKNKEGKGMLISAWMLTEEIKVIGHYKMYAAVFRVDVPTIQSQLVKSI
nr:hypothetical protein [Tanacetum cinerariifolium]